MTPQSLAEARIRRQNQLSAGIIVEARKLWRQIETRDIRRSWLELIPLLFNLLRRAQVNSADGATEYVASVLRSQGIDPDAVGRVSVGALAGVASDGRPLETLLYQPAIASVAVIDSGGTPAQGLRAGRGLLDTIIRTQLADAGRQAVAVDTAARRYATGYVRMVVGKTCGRCVVLAGKFYRYNQGFNRHPRCDCVHVPSRESIAGDLSTDARRFFDSLSRADQDKQFGLAGAEAIRSGADISRVVNARRGAFGLAPASGRLTAAERASLGVGRLQTRNVFGRDLYTTTEATTRRGINRKVRLMPESIFSIAESKEDALRLLRVHGYII